MTKAAAKLADKNEEAQKYLKEVLVPANRIALENLRQLVEPNKNAANAAARNAGETFDQTLEILWIVLASAGIGAGIAFTFAVIGISEPITAITQSMRGLAAGDSHTAIPFAGRQALIRKDCPSPICGMPSCQRPKPVPPQRARWSLQKDARRDSASDPWGTWIQVPPPPSSSCAPCEVHLPITCDRIGIEGLSVTSLFARARSPIRAATLTGIMRYPIDPTKKSRFTEASSGQSALSARSDAEPV